MHGQHQGRFVVLEDVIDFLEVNIRVKVQHIEFLGFFPQLAQHPIVKDGTIRYGMMVNRWP
jgi:hypothetical protein